MAQFWGEKLEVLVGGLQKQGWGTGVCVCPPPQVPDTFAMALLSRLDQSSKIPSIERGRH